MTIKVQNLSDLQDRRIMMEKKLPPYGYAFVILVGIFMLFLVVWSTHTNRIYVSQNAGTVQASNKTYIMSSYSGSITEMYISEGSYVNEGDLVAHIKSTDIDMQQDNLESSSRSTRPSWTSTTNCCSACRMIPTTSARQTPKISLLLSVRDLQEPGLSEDL